MFLEWAAGAIDEAPLDTILQSYARFTSDVNWAQARYEECGHYEYSSFDNVYRSHYAIAKNMHGYLWGVYVSHFLWAHHWQITQHYHDRFLPRIRPGSHSTA